MQSPRTVNDESGDEIVVKPECYVFDFAPNRALRQIADYGSRLATDETTPEQRVAELVGFLPVLAYDGSSMRQLDAAAILDIATSGTSATLLAKRWVKRTPGSRALTVTPAGLREFKRQFGIELRQPTQVQRARRQKP